MLHVPWHLSQKAGTAAMLSKYQALKKLYLGTEEGRSYFVFPSEMAVVLIQVVGVQAHTSQGNVHLQVTSYVKILFISPTHDLLLCRKESKNYEPRTECNMSQT